MNWNVNWARSSSERGRKIREILETCVADAICLTEGTRDLLPSSGLVVDSEPDYGVRLQKERRKAGNPGRGIGEWGFAALLEVDGRRLLLDTGERPETVSGTLANSASIYQT